jgi:hypothetical protein
MSAAFRMEMDLNEFGGELLLTRHSVLDSIAQAQTSTRNSKAIEKIRYFFERALRYTTVQSDAFYQALRSCHRDNSSALKIIDFFEADIKDLRLKLFIFGEEFFSDKPVRNIRILAAGFKELSRMVLERVAVEDSQLLPLLNPSGKVRCQQN